MKHIAITDLSEASLEKYLNNLREALPSLPQDIQRYVHECGLHDAGFVDLNVSVPDESVSIEFIGDCLSDAVPKSFARRFRFTYRGVASFTFHEMKDARGHPVPTTLQYVDHDRITRLSPEHIEHRIIFHDGAEFCARFRDFSLWYEDFEYVPA